MSFLQFVTGSRSQEFVELNPTASLIVGSSSSAHIQLHDPDVQQQHCRIYPAQGAFWLQDLGQGFTILNMKRLSNETEGLRANDVFIVGRTFIKFWAEKPPATGGGGGADPAELETARRRVSQLEAELEQARASSAGQQQGAERVQMLMKALGEKDAELDEVRAKMEAIESWKNKGDQKVGNLEAELVDSRQQMELLAQDVLDREEQLTSLRTDLEKERESSRMNARRLEVELEDVKAHAQKEVERVWNEATAKGREEGRGEALPKLKETEGELKEMRATLEATRAALESLGVARPAETIAAGGSPLQEALAALGLEPAQQQRLMAALSGEIDRESLRRFAGPALAWSEGTPERDLPGELRGLRRRNQRVDVAMTLDPNELVARQLKGILGPQ